MYFTSLLQYEKNSSKSHLVLVNVLGEQMCRKGFAEFKSGTFDLKGEQHAGAPKKFEDEELELVLPEDASQRRKEELTKTLEVTHEAIFRRLKVMGMIRKLGN